MMLLFQFARLFTAVVHRWRYRKSEKQVINYNPSHVRGQKFGELWSTNKKVIGAHVDASGMSTIISSGAVHQLGY